MVAVIVFFQAAWAGMFIRENKDYNATWGAVHSRGADLAILLTIVAAIVVFIKLRKRRDLLIATITRGSYIGGRVAATPGSPRSTSHSPWPSWDRACGYHYAPAASPPPCSPHSPRLTRPS